MWTAFLVDGVAMAALHNALPFGILAACTAGAEWTPFPGTAQGSCCTWSRSGLLMFRVEYARTAEHGVMCFALLGRGVLGAREIAPAKLALGMPMNVLGLEKGDSLPRRSRHSDRIKGFEVGTGCPGSS